MTMILMDAPKEYEKEEPKRYFQGVWIPAEIWLNKSLSCTEKFLLAEIGSLTHPVKGCFASNNYNCEFG